MKKQMFLSALLLALCLAGSLTVQAQNIDPDDANLETQLYLIVGTNQEVDEPRLPATLDNVIKQLRASLPFKNYRLAATLLNRVKNEGRLELSFIGGPLATQSMAATSTAPSFSSFKVRQVKLSRSSENMAVVQMLGFNFGTRFPIQSPGPIAANGAVTPILNYENTGVYTDISMREGDPVIVGTLNVGPSNDAIILVVSAKKASMK